MEVKIVLLSNYTDRVDIQEWFEWHLYHCKFDHIHVLDNSEGSIITDVAKKYGGKISCERIDGFPDQYALYNKYFASEKISKNKWIICLDDDEYFDFDTSKYSSVQDVLRHYKQKFPYIHMLSPVWKFLWPDEDKMFAKRDCSTMKFCNRDSFETTCKFLGETKRFFVKTFVNYDGKVYYQKIEENPQGGHIPRHEKTCFSILCDGTPIINNKGTAILRYEQVKDFDIRILHRKYRSYDEFMNKNHFKVCTQEKDILKISDRMMLENLERIKCES